MNLRQKIFNALRVLKSNRDKPISANRVAFEINEPIPDVKVILSQMLEMNPPIITSIKEPINGEIVTLYWTIKSQYQVTDMLNKQKPISNAMPKVATEIIKEEQKMTNYTNYPNYLEIEPMELRLIAYIKNNPKCTIEALEKNTGSRENCAQSKIEKYILSNLIIKSRILNENNRKQIVFSVSPDYANFSAQEIYDEKVKIYGNTKPRTKSPEVIDTPNSALIDSRKEEAVTIIGKAVEAAAIKTDKDLSTQYGSFKVAYTSDGTLLMFGISFQPIELNPQQTRLLNNYLNTLEVI